MKRLGLCLLLACGGSPRSTTSPSDPLAGLPPAAAATLRAEAHGATIEHVRHEVDEGIDFYRADWHDSDDTYHEATVTKDGSLAGHHESESTLKD